MWRNLSYWSLVIVFVCTLAVAFFGNVPNAEFMRLHLFGIEVDKIAHLLYLGALATLLAKRLNVWVVIILGVSIALAVEIIQPNFHRAYDLDDALWGVIGTAAAWGLYQIGWYRRLMEWRVF
jgi:glycopeptide antibiotics resistance protein